MTHSGQPRITTVLRCLRTCLSPEARLVLLRLLELKRQGAGLPSIQRLAKELNLSRICICQARLRLWMTGVLVLTDPEHPNLHNYPVGAGFRICLRALDGLSGTKSSKPVIPGAPPASTAAAKPGLTRKRAVPPTGAVLPSSSSKAPVPAKPPTGATKVQGLLGLPIKSPPAAGGERA